MSSSSSSSDDDGDGGMPAKRDVLGSDSESDDDDKLRVNESFAASFAKREKKRLDARGKALGADGSESDASSSESEDEDAVELTRGMDVIESIFVTGDMERPGVDPSVKQGPNMLQVQLMGNKYLEQEFPGFDKIKYCKVIQTSL